MRPRTAGVTAGVLTLLLGAAVAADEHPADVCLEIVPGTVSADDWAAVAAVVDETVAERTALFSDPTLNLEAARLDIDSGHFQGVRGHATCLEPGYEWGARFGRDFLEAGADQMLAEAPTTPGIGSEVSLEWYPDETRVRTTLVFAGPLDFPNGTCWIDDALMVDAATGTVTTSGEEGVKTSPFAEGACNRFFDHLPNGGAGEQAVTLLPVSVVLTDGTTLRFVAEGVVVAEDAVSVFGSLARG